MKHDTYQKYLGPGVQLPDQGLLTAWDCLAAYREDLVLAGGLAIKHLTHPPEQGLPGPVTLDVDFGIRIGASSGMYGNIRDTLGAQGFDWENGEHRFVKNYGGFNLYIDLLTDDGKSDTGTAIVDDSLPVGTVPGIGRALEVTRDIEITGRTLVGSESTQIIRVAEVGPMLALKLNAFGGPVGRKAPKDVHDVLYLAMNYLDGTDRAIAAFHEERTAGNKAVPHALNALEEYFSDSNALGPMSCAAFRMNNQHEALEFREESMQIRQQCVTLAQALLS